MVDEELELEELEEDEEEVKETAPKKNELTPFELAIKEYLEMQAKDDVYLASRLNNPKKNIQECCEYIISEVKKTQRNGFADEEIYAMARHYYNEDVLKFEKGVKAKVVVNKEIAGENKKQTSKAQKAGENSNEQLSLFDLSV